MTESDLMIKIENNRVLAILQANDIPFDEKIFLQTEAPTREARAISATCLEMIRECIVYGLNNGFDSVKVNIQMLIKVICTLSSATLKEKETKKSAKQVEKEDKNIQKEFIRDALCFPQKYTLGIQTAVASFAADTHDCIDVYKQEIETMTEDKFKALLSVAGKGPETIKINDWKRRSTEFLEAAKTLLSKIHSEAEAVLDASSQFAMSKARAIVEKIKVWRDEVAYSYLFFDKRSNDCLQTALNEVTAWEEACVGVGKKYPRAMPGDLEKLFVRDVNGKLIICDQMYVYCQASKRSKAS